MDKSENRVAMGYQTASFSIKQAYLHALYIFYVVSEIFPKNRKNYENKDNPPLSWILYFKWGICSFFEHICLIAIAYLRVLL